MPPFDKNHNIKGFGRQCPKYVPATLKICDFVKLVEFVSKKGFTLTYKCAKMYPQDSTFTNNRQPDQSLKSTSRIEANAKMVSERAKRFRRNDNQNQFKQENSNEHQVLYRIAEVIGECQRVETRIVRVIEEVVS
jgi:hypothetical protein